MAPPSLTQAAPNAAPQSTPEQPETQASPAEENPSESPAESSAEDGPTPFQWDLRISRSILTDNGTNDGAPIAIGNFGEEGNFALWQGQARASFALARLSDGATLRAGPILTANHFAGDENTIGSNITALDLGAFLELDISGHTSVADGVVSLVPRFWLAASGGIGWGITQAETTNLHEQIGPNVDLEFGIDLLEVRLPDSNIDIGLGAFIGTNATFGSSFNSAFNSIGVNLILRGPNEPTPPPAPVEEITCSDTRNERLASRIEFLQGENGTLREGNARHQEVLNHIQGQLDEQGVTTEQLLENIRTAYVQVMLANPTEELEAIEDEAARQARAEELALEQYPEDFDPYSMPEVAQADVPDPLPEDCDELDLIVQGLEDERAELNYKKGLMEGTITGLLIRLGMRPQVAEQASHIITQFRDIHFITNRPYGGEDNPPGNLRNIVRQQQRAGTPLRLTIEEITQAVESWRASPEGQQRTEDGQSAQMPMDQQMAIFRAIFPSSTDVSNGEPVGTFNPALRTIQGLSDLLRQSDMRDAFVVIRGHTDSRGSDDYNSRLSQRRADVVGAALRADGIAGERVLTRGLGETDPVYYYDSVRGRTSRVLSTQERQALREAGIVNRALNDEMAGRQVTNRRVEVFICTPNSDNPHCIQAASILNPGEGAAEDHAHPGDEVQEIETEGSHPEE